MKLLSSCLPTVQYNQTWSCDYFSVLFEEKKNYLTSKSKLLNSGSSEVFSSLYAQTKYSMCSKVNLIKFSVAKKCLLIQWGRNPSVRMRGRNILPILPHLQNGSKAPSFSSLLPIQNAAAKKIICLSNIFGDIATI